MGLSNDKRITDKTNKLDKLQKTLLWWAKEVWHKRAHWHEVQEQVKQIYTSVSQSSFNRVQIL